MGLSSLISPVNVHVKLLRMTEAFVLQYHQYMDCTQFSVFPSLPFPVPSPIYSLLFFQFLVSKTLGFSSRQSNREVYLHHLNLNRLIWSLLMIIKWCGLGPTDGSLNKYDCFSLARTMRKKPNYSWLGFVSPSKTGGDAHICLVQTPAICLWTMGKSSGWKDSNFLLVFLNILCVNLTVGENYLWI